MVAGRHIEQCSVSRPSSEDLVTVLSPDSSIRAVVLDAGYLAGGFLNRKSDGFR